MKSTVDIQDFIRIWQGSETLAEVCERTGMTKSQASQRASRLRSGAAKGLKEFRRGPVRTFEVPDPATARATLVFEDVEKGVLTEEEARERLAESMGSDVLGDTVAAPPASPSPSPADQDDAGGDW